MKQTFQIISIKFPQFTTADWTGWFQVKLTPFLPSLTADMLLNITSNTNCTIYQVM